MSEPSRFLNASIRIYRVLLRAYPASFRRDYGEEMAILFQEMAEDALCRGGAAGLGGLCCRMLLDVVSTAIGQHLLATTRRTAMLRILFSPGYRVLALAVALLIGALVTPPDPLSMLIVGLPLYVVYLCACRVVWHPKDVRSDRVSNAN